MDIINKLHSAFRDCLYFEFGEGYVKFYDPDCKKYFVVRVEEVKRAEKTILKGVGAKISQKTTKDKQSISVNDFKQLIKLKRKKQ